MRLYLKISSLKFLKAAKRLKVRLPIDGNYTKSKKPIKNCIPVNYELFKAVGGGIEPPRGS
jgi:hypothetical protein